MPESERAVEPRSAVWRVRRARRSDFPLVAEFCARVGAGSLEADRRTLRRFRHIVADLGNDLYLAHDGEILRGLVHIVYSRRLLGSPTAEVALLLVDPESSPGEVADRLLGFALQRAGKRECACVVFRATELSPWIAAALHGKGFQRCGEWYATAALGACVERKV